MNNCQKHYHKRLKLKNGTPFVQDFLVGTVFNSKNQSNLAETKIAFIHFNIITMQQKSIVSSLE